MRYKCEQCGANRGLAKYKSGEYCFSCKYFKKEKNLIYLEKKKTKLDELEVSNVFPEQALKYLRQYYINDHIINNNNIKWVSNYNRIGFFFGKNLNSCYLRSINKTDKTKWLLKQEEKKYYFKSKKSDILLVVEDAISLIRVFNVLNVDVLCLGGTNFYSSMLVPLFFNYKNLISWFDGDIAGKQASEKFRQRFKLSHNIRNIQTLKDPKEYSDREVIKLYEKL